MDAKRQTGRGKKLVKLGFSLLLIILAVWVFTHRQALQDQLALAGYEPSAAIADLAADASLSPLGTKLFYVTDPELHGKDTFSQVCQGLGDEKSNVLGCFTGQRIYIYDVPDERLSGVREVTAAHEMLHAAYMRLSGDERQRVDDLIRKQLETNVAPHVEELIAIYERLEPDQILNEMHSILATEQRDLLPELEQYFSQYFDDRDIVVSLSDEYRSVFESLRREQQQLAEEIDTLATQINDNTEALNRQINEYNVAVEAFNARASSGTMSRQEFEQERAQLTEERNAIEVAADANDALRATYSQKREQFESLAVEFAQLQNTLDSQPAAPQDVQ